VEIATYQIAFVAGLLGSAHCIGMCGALVSSFFMATPRGHVAPYAVYHGARLAVYTLIGALAAALGVALVSTGLVGKVQGVLQIVVGLLVILLALDVGGLLPRSLSIAFAPAGLVRVGMAHALRAGPVPGAAVAGAVNGVMPCSLTLAMAVQATTLESVPAGAGMMLAFGLGTLPSMLFVSVAFGRLGTRLRGWLLKGAAVVVAAMGAATLWQGITYFNVMRKLGNW
jgi:hypothetical protein